MTRYRNRSTAWWALLAIFFAQMATAAYACPLVGEARSSATPSGEMSTPCAEMEKAPSANPTALCLEHCKVGQQLVDTHPVADDVASFPVLAFLVLPVHIEVAV